ncbi:Lrp/AsnC family transcriptional regulator [Vibrio salinus]|uniref:Lrp/AsnC family transcriptional regulator n=1 Tax=Vibrio salinus TaxID=2899784 RepID=UPI001E51A0A3|nr:Lrp/AsnC family transcriptional regulator [Vibrio salinus]MCE0495323.1 Lrp/AsnC family transcriptional regulator [Vibrio salinus]
MYKDNFDRVYLVMRDRFDQQILDLLQQNARISVSELAKSVNLSRTAVTARIKKLEQDGTIEGYHAVVTNKRPDSENTICAYLALKFDTSTSNTTFESYAQRIQLIDGVFHCYGISGETDLMVYIEVESMKQLYSLHDRLNQLEHMRQVTTHMVIRQFF